MAATADAAPQPPAKRKHEKLSRLPEYAKTSKRPLLRPPIPSPFASAASQKVVYVKHSTPFISLVKRVRKPLSKVQERETQSLLSRKTPLTAKEVEAAIAKGADVSKGRSEEVFVKATGRAIERALNVALFFQKQGDCRVRIQTGTVDAVDDIEVDGRKKRMMEEKANREAKEAGGADKPGKVVDREDEKELPEARIRHTNCIEVAISLK